MNVLKCILAHVVVAGAVGLGLHAIFTIPHMLEAVLISGALLCAVIIFVLSMAQVIDCWSKK